MFYRSGKISHRCWRGFPQCILLKKKKSFSWSAYNFSCCVLFWHRTLWNLQKQHLQLCKSQPFESWCLHITFSHSINLNVLTAMWLTVNPWRLRLQKESSLFEDFSLWRVCHTSQTFKLCSVNIMAQCWATSCELLSAFNSCWTFRNCRNLSIYRKSWDF